MLIKDAGAVITGGASGIGLATALMLGRRGARVIIADVQAVSLEKAREQLLAAGLTDVHIFQCDVASAEQVGALADYAFSLGSVGLVFNNAGIGVGGPLLDMTAADWDWVMGVNLRGAVNGIHAFVPRMIAQRTPAHILFNASFAGLVPVADLGVYSVSKAGVIALAEVLRQELRSSGIGVTVVCPMRVDTDISASSRNRTGTESRAKELVSPQDESVAGSIITPAEAALYILNAVELNQLYAMTHEEGREFVTKRFQRMNAAFDLPSKPPRS